MLKEQYMLDINLVWCNHFSQTNPYPEVSVPGREQATMSSSFLTVLQAVSSVLIGQSIFVPLNSSLYGPVGDTKWIVFYENKVMNMIVNCYNL